MAGTLGTALSSLIDSLNTNQASLSYVSNNISNANTTGYTRRILSQETKVSNGVASGVGVLEARRAVDEFVVNSARSQVTFVGYSKVKNDFYDRLHSTVLGAPGSAGTVGKTLSDFYTALDSYSNDPSSAVKRTLSVNAASNLGLSISNLASQIQQERLNADTSFSNKIGELNSLLSDLTDLNASIQQNFTAGGDLNSLYDVRDTKLLRLKELVGASITINDFGQASAYINNTELLSPSSKYTVNYTRIGSVSALNAGNTIGAITVTGTDATGREMTGAETLYSASNVTPKVDNLPAGELRGLIEIRDIEFPKIIDQLDTLAYNLVEQFNKVHNLGSGYPPAQKYTGQELFSANEKFNFSGAFTVALVDANGNPVKNTYGEDLIPMNFDLSKFDSGTGPGTASIADLMKEINNYFSSPASSTVNLGPLKDVKLGAVSNNITSVKAAGTLNFGANPLNGSTIVVNGVTLNLVDSPSGPNDIQRGSSVTTTVSNIAAYLNESSNTSIDDATYSANGNILTITHKNGGTTGNTFTFADGTTGVAIASGATLSGGTSASGTFTFDFEMLGLDPNNGNLKFDVQSLEVNGTPSTYNFNQYVLAPGSRQRTDNDATINDSLTINIPAGLNEGDTFTVAVGVKVTDSAGNSYDDVINYTITVPDPADNIRNTRYSATSISGTGDAAMDTSELTFGLLNARIVDAKGNPVTDPNTKGYLQIESANSNYRIVIDDGTSSNNGIYNIPNSEATATGRGFSHMFGMNNLFNSLSEVKNSAMNLSVRSDILKNPANLSSARLTRSAQTGISATYTYQIGSSSNAIAQELVKIQNKNVQFNASGGLPTLSTTFDSFTTEIYNSATVGANQAQSELDKQSLLYDAITQKMDELGGVNIDEEVALTVSIQNNYAASARLLSIIKELFEQLNQTL